FARPSHGGAPMDEEHKLLLALTREIEQLRTEIGKLESSRAELVRRLQHKEREREGIISTSFDSLILKEQAHKAKTTTSRVGEREGTRPYEIIKLLESAPDKAF